MSDYEHARRDSNPRPSDSKGIGVGCEKPVQAVSGPIRTKPNQKFCHACQTAKSKADFSRSKATKDGLQAQCKPCKRAGQRRSYYRHHEKSLARQRRIDAKRDRAKRRVQAETNYAIKVGSLIRQPCEVCGELKVDAHHDDYSQPLEVRWLCRAHHRQHHADHGYPSTEDLS